MPHGHFADGLERPIHGQVRLGSAANRQALRGTLRKRQRLLIFLRQRPTLDKTALRRETHGLTVTRQNRRRLERAVLARRRENLPVRIDQLGLKIGGLREVAEELLDVVSRHVEYELVTPLRGCKWNLAHPRPALRRTSRPPADGLAVQPDLVLRRARRLQDERTSVRLERRREAHVLVGQSVGCFRPHGPCLLERRRIYSTCRNYHLPCSLKSSAFKVRHFSQSQ